MSNSKAKGLMSQNSFLTSEKVLHLHHKDHHLNTFHEYNHFMIEMIYNANSTLTTKCLRFDIESSGAHTYQCVLNVQREV